MPKLETPSFLLLAVEMVSLSSFSCAIIKYLLNFSTCCSIEFISLFNSIFKKQTFGMPTLVKCSAFFTYKT